VAQTGKARKMSGALLLLFGALAAAIGGWALHSERGMRARAVETVGTVTAHLPAPRSSYTRLGFQRDSRPVPRIDYRDREGAAQRAWLYPWHTPGLPVGSEVAILYDRHAPGNIRLRDEPEDRGFPVALAAVGVVLMLAGGLVLARRKDPPPVAGPKDEKNEPDFIGPLPRGRSLALYSLAGWPVIELEPVGGGWAILAFERETGAMVLRHDLWERLRQGSIDLDVLDMSRFRALLRERRADILATLQNQPLAWRETGDLDFPYAGSWGGVEARLRLNDFPAEPMFSVIARHQNVGNLEDWPACWTRLALED